MQGGLEHKAPSPTTALHMVRLRGSQRTLYQLFPSFPLPSLPPSLPQFSPNLSSPKDAFSENSKYLQKALIAYLNKRSETDPSCAVS